MQSNNEAENVLFRLFFSSLTVLGMVFFIIVFLTEPINLLSGIISLTFSLLIQREFPIPILVYPFWLFSSLIPLWQLTIVSFVPSILALMTVLVSYEIETVTKMISDLEGMRYKLKSA